MKFEFPVPHQDMEVLEGQCLDTRQPGTFRSCRRFRLRVGAGQQDSADPQRPRFPVVYNYMESSQLHRLHMDLPSQ